MSRQTTYKLVRTNKKTGFTEVCFYTGSLANKPKGWRLADIQY